MKPLKSFDEFLDNGIVKNITPDINRSKSLIKESKKRMKFLEELVKTMKITSENSNYVVENSYDALMEKIRSIMYKKGVSSSGIGAHEAEVAYTMKLGLNEKEVRFLNELRYKRNGILYYGKDCSKEYAVDVYEFVKKVISKISD